MSERSRILLVALGSVAAAALPRAASEPMPGEPLAGLTGHGGAVVERRSR